AVGEVFPGPGDALHLGLAAELAFRSYLAGDAGDFGGEGVELIDHRVDRVLQLQDLPADIDRDLLRQVAVRNSRGDFGDVSYLAGKIAGHRVHTVGEVLPGPGHAAHFGLAPKLAFGPYLAG